MITTFSLGKERNETLASGRSKNETVTEILEKVGNLKQNLPELRFSDYVSTKVLRRGNKESMRSPALAKPLMLLTSVFRKGNIHHPLIVGFLFTKDDLNIISLNRVTYHSFVFVSWSFKSSSVFHFSDIAFRRCI